MKNKCPNCKLVNYPNAEKCARCGALFYEIGYTDTADTTASSIKRRAVICVAVCLFTIAGFYVSMVFSASGLSFEQKQSVRKAIQIIEDKGFSSEAMMLKRLAVFRSNDNWFNASVDKESAFAATNFPFEIVTLYPDFFSYTADDTERAAILLHEARHLKGEDEKEAYEFVWRNRKKLGWAGEAYANSTVWTEVRKQTREYAPNLFVCDVNSFGDCTESSN
jgi:hypothetical protein